MAFKRDKTLAAAQKAVRKGNLDKAIKEYLLLVEDDPSDKRTRLKLADIYVKSSKLNEALAEYRHVGKQYAAEDFHEKAAAIYKQALRIAPEDAALYQNLGFAYFQYGRAKDAIRAYSKAERIYKENGQTSAHLTILEKMLDVDPENVGIQIQLAERCEKNGDRQRAIQYFEEASKQLEQEGRTDEYIQVCERLIFLAPDQTNVRKSLIRIYHGRSDNKRALRHLQVCFKSQPEDVETLELLGSTFHRLNEDKKALLVYKQLAQGFRSNPARAREVYQTILRIDPSDSEAIEALGIAKTTVGAFPIPAAVPPSLEEADSLAGVAFLDDDDVDFVETTKPSSKSGDDFLDFAEDAMKGFGDDFDLDGIDEIPTFRAEKRNQEEIPFMDFNAQETTGEISFLDADQSVDEIPFMDVESEPEVIANEKLSPLLAAHDQERINEILAEAEVFIKYNLLDQAKDVLLKAIDIGPDEKQPREQLASVLERKGEVDGAARQWVELARICVHANDPTQANAFVRRALTASSNPEKIRSDIDECGITGRVFLAGPSPQLPRVDFKESMDRLDEISTSFLDIEQDPALTGQSEIQNRTSLEDPSEDILEMDIEFDDAMTLDAELFNQTDDDDEVFDLLFENSETVPNVPKVPAVGKAPEPAKNSNGFGNISLTNAFQSINATNEPSSANFLNTHLELGTTYFQMELYEEAIVEFRIAMKDPAAKEEATLQIALCQVELGDTNSARGNFRRLLNNPNTSPESRQTANEHLAKI